MKQLITFLLFIFLSFSVLSGDGIWQKRILLSSLTNNSSYRLQDRSHIKEDVRELEFYEGFLYLNYTRKLHSDLRASTYWKLEVDYTVPNSTVTGTLLISYQNGSYVYSDYGKIPANVTLSKGFEVIVSNLRGYVDSGNGWVLEPNVQTSTVIPSDIELQLELHSSRHYSLQPTDYSNLLLEKKPDTYEVKWDYVQGAEEYDLEWVFIDKYSAEYSILTNNSNVVVGGFNDPFVLKEPARVRVWGTSYSLDKTYPEGKLFFRIRSVNSFIKNGKVLDQVKTSDWNYCTDPTQMSSTLSVYYLASLLIGSSESFSKEKNWLYGVAYAEGGKSVSSMSIYDGSNRSRQNMTYNTSDNVTLVSETKYDYEGRQVISIIPGPVRGRKLGYHSNFNVALDGGSFQEEELDVYV